MVLAGVVVGGFGWFWLVLAGFGWLWVVVGGFGSFLVLVCTLKSYPALTSLKIKVNGIRANTKRRGDKLSP